MCSLLALGILAGGMLGTSIASHTIHERAFMRFNVSDARFVITTSTTLSRLRASKVPTSMSLWPSLKPPYSVTRPQSPSSIRASL
ncbi:hypothetical protein R3P38DRAFT_2915136, partial [Favolaschia claudopus]